jgi:hypothetical protein
MKGMVSDAGQSLIHHIKGIGSELASGLIGPIAGGAVIAQFEILAQKVEAIKRVAETLKVSASFVQDLQNAGKASGVGAELIEKALDKFAQGLAPGSDVEESLLAFADRLAGIEDPGERARMAVEAFGKAGMKMIPILGEGSKGLALMAEGFGKISDGEIEAIEQGKRFQDQTMSWVDSITAGFFYAVKKSADYTKNLFGELKKIKFSDLYYATPQDSFGHAWNKTMETEYQAIIDRSNKIRKEKEGRTAAEIADAREQEYKSDMEAWEKYQKLKYERDYNRASMADKLAMLRTQERALFLEAQEIDNYSDSLELLTAMDEVNDKILEVKKKMGTESEKETALLEKQLALLEKMPPLRGAPTRGITPNQTIGQRAADAPQINPVLAEFLELRGKLTSGHLNDFDKKLYGQRAKEDWKKLPIAERFQAMMPENLPKGYSVEQLKSIHDTLLQTLKLMNEHGIKVFTDDPNK